MGEVVVRSDFSTGGSSLFVLSVKSSLSMETSIVLLFRATSKVQCVYGVDFVFLNYLNSVILFI